ncbi:MAG: hypothetical protein QM704_16760 [Anaeromyxobacteraceae bacterium]
MRALLLLVAAAALSAGGAARAGPAVTLNGVPIDGVTGQKIENATVVIDDRGDIHITAKGYAVRSDEPAPATARAAPVPAGGAPVPAAPTAPAAVTRRYFLATEHAAPGTGFDLAIFINSQWIREVKANEPQVVMEITKYLRPGQNRLVLSATRKGDRPSTSKDVTLRVVVGEGNIGGDHVMIDETLVEAVRTAAEESRSEEFVVQAR